MMKSLLFWLHRMVAWQVAFCRWMLVGLCAAMTVLILLQVFFRFVIYIPFPWSEECARYLMIWMGFLGSVIALHEHRHIGVTFFMDKLPSVPKGIAERVVQVAMIIFLGILCRQGVLFALFNAEQRSPAMEISMLIPYSAIPVGSAMMILVIIAQLLDPVVKLNKEGV